MTVLTTSSDITYAGLAGQSLFAYNFRVDEKTDMNITLDNVAVAQSEFTMTGLGSSLGGTVTLNTPLVLPAIVVLFRVLDLTQLVDYQPFDPFPAETHEGALDKLTMLIQEGNASVLRSLRFPVGDNANPILPDVANRNSKYLAFDGAGGVVAIPGTNESPNAVLKPVNAVTLNNLMMFDAFKNSLDSGFSVADLIDLMHPVTSVLYFRDASIDPNILYPNTIWIQLPEGQMLISQGVNFPAGSTGGNADAVVSAHTHTFTGDPLGTHEHDLQMFTIAHSSGEDTGYGIGSDLGPSGTTRTMRAPEHKALPVSSGTPTGTTDNAGSNPAGANLPPYLAVYAWERVASLPPATPEFDAHWARVTDKTCPTIETDLRTLFAALLNSGLWDLIDDLCIIHCNAADSLLGIKGFQDSVHAGPVPNWNAQRGYRLGTTEDFEDPNPNLTNWIDSGIIDNGSTNFTTDSRMMFYQILSPDFSSGATVVIRGSIGGVLSGEGESAFIQIFENSDLSQFIDEGDLAGATFNASGLYLGSRESGTVINFLVEDDFQTAVATSNGATPNAFTMLVGATADTDGSPLMTEFYTSDMVAWGFGGGLNQAQSEALRDIIKTYTTARGVSDSPEFDTHWARVVDKSDPTLEADLKALFTTLIANGVYDLLDDLCVIHTGMADSLLGLKGFQDSVLPVGNEPTFNVATGFTTTAAASAGTGTWIDTVITQTLTPQYSVDSMSAFDYFISGPGGNFAGYQLMGNKDNIPSTLIIYDSSNVGTIVQMKSGFNDSTNQAQVSSFGFYGVTRTGPGSTEAEFIRDGVTTSLDTATGAGTFDFATSIFVGGVAQGGVSAAVGTTGTENHIGWGIGGGLTTAQLTALEAALDAYAAARGF